MVKNDDFDLNIKKYPNPNKQSGKINPKITSRYLCTGGTCWKGHCITDK